MIAKQLKIPTSAIMNGITQQQADKIEELSLQEDDVNLLKHFRNLKKLNIKSNLKDMGKRYDLNITDMEKLEILEIIATKGITNINLDNVPNLYYANISGNKTLENVNGLEDIEGFMKLFMIGNESLKEIPDIQELAKKENIDSIHVDFSWLSLMEDKYGSLDTLCKDCAMRNSIKWRELIGRFSIPLEFEEGIEAEKKSNLILDEIIDDSMTDVEKICAINTWAINNVKYDYNVMEERKDSTEGKIDFKGIRLTNNVRANSAYNALVLNLAVCEGFTNGMKYLLNKVGIEAEKVDCRYWEEDEEKTQYINSKNSNHSIIRFKTEHGWFYSDPTFDSEHPDKRKFFFKTKKEISNIHGLAINEMNVDSPEVRPEEYSNEKLSKILTGQLKRNRKNEKQVSKDDKKEYKEQPETKNRPDDNPENWRKSFRFNISPEQYQEVLDVHKQLEKQFEQGEIENPEDKVEPTEHGVR